MRVWILHWIVAHLTNIRWIPHHRNFQVRQNIHRRLSRNLHRGLIRVHRAKYVIPVQSFLIVGFHIKLTKSF